MMSLVATPIVAARVAAPKKVRTQTVAKASSADQAKSSAVAGALALTMLAQPALAMNELGQIADKQADAKALAAAQFAELQVKKKAPTAAPKTKNLAAGLPSLSLPSISAPSVGGGSKSAPAVKAAKAAPAEKIEVRRVPPLSLYSRRERERGRARARGARARPPIATTTSSAIASRFFPTLADSPIGRSCRKTSHKFLFVLTLTFRFRTRSERPQGQGKLGFAMAILFSPLLAVAGLSLQTLLRVVPQAAEGKDFFPKDTMPF